MECRVGSRNVAFRLRLRFSEELFSSLSKVGRQHASYLPMFAWLRKFDNQLLAMATQVEPQMTRRISCCCMSTAGLVTVVLALR